MKQNEFKKAVQLFLNSKSGATRTAYKRVLVQSSKKIKKG